LPARETLIGHETYWRPDVFSIERSRIFGRCWLLAGLASDFAAGGRISTAGQHVTIERSAAAWHGRSEGRPVHVENCGELIFYCLSDKAPSLEDYFAPCIDDLRRIAAGLGPALHRNDATMEANWKILVENTVDDYHTAAVHPHTLHPSLLDDGRRHRQVFCRGRHTLFRNRLNPADRAFWEKLCRRLNAARFDNGTGYQHLFLYPNTYVASFYSAMSVVHRINPLTEERSQLEWRICLPLSGQPTTAREILRRAAVTDLAAKARRVIEEDKAICSAAQEGAHYAVRPGLCGEYELRIIDFQEALLADYELP
jgi:phenylpropionate dioxygenase-like ring-hydroxylating dioxygenase large terminal subunit